MLPLTAPVAIAAAPAPLPDPDDRSTFNARAYAFNGWEVAELGPKVTTNAQATYDNALAGQDAATLAQAAQAAATASANYKGAWSALTGALAVPASVSHLGYQWMLLQNLANVTTQTPGSAPTYWEQIGKYSGSAAAGVNELAGPNIASAATTMDIWAAAQGNLMTVTGTTTTTGLPAAPQAGAERWLVAAGAWPLTAGANLLIAGLTSGQSVTLAAGDLVMVRALTTTQFKLLVFKADGSLVAGPGSRLHVRDQAANGAAYAALTASAWNDRDLDTVVTNVISGASLGSNQITLPAGTYDIEAYATAYSAANSFHSRLKLVNVTDAAVALLGLNEYVSLGGVVALRGRVTIAGTKAFKVQQYISAGVTVSGGQPTGGTDAEYYAEVIVTKVSA